MPRKLIDPEPLSKPPAADPPALTDEERAASEPIAPEAPEPAPAPKPKEGPATREYVVAGAAIAPFGNTNRAKKEHGEAARLYDVGEQVNLTNQQAREYIKLGRLQPFVPED